jgi:tetratricopeptide (TPR) repeat protein
MRRYPEGMHRSRVSGVIAAALALCCAAPASACVNTFQSNILHYKQTGNAEGIAVAVRDLEQEYAKKPTLENSNDLAVARILTGKYDAAVALLRETDQKFPGSAKVAANLGSALDLLGQDEDALEWIREGVKRDAGEHQGSEWLHARILEAKIALKKDPKWLEKNRVLNLDFGTGEVPVAPEILPVEKGKLKGVEQLLEQISYQTHERTQFVRPPDAILGDLFASAGDLSIAGGASILDGGSSKPDEYYEGALKYGAPRAALIRKRLERYKADVAAMPPPPPRTEAASGDSVQDYPVVNKRFAPPQKRSYALLIWLGAGTALTLVLVFVGWLVDRHRRKKAELNPPPPLPDVD